MAHMTSRELRAGFLHYFRNHGHEVVPGSSLVPANDPTLLFTNAGMVQFKEAFLGRVRRAIPRTASAQPCVRAGGKHNDLENVGYTARHHTFFEMLGNFSFGDYFKREAIGLAWAFLTDTLEIPAEKLWVTVFEEDEEAADIWLKEQGVASDRFSRCGPRDNFWSMGDTGPCGPCSEIFFDHGSQVPGDPPGSPNEGGERYVEIWNLVFMQFDRDAQGHLTPLPKPSVDTGMGLERLAAVLQGVHNNYDIDLFQRLTKATAEIIDTRNPTDKSLRVIADHIRSSAFLIADGVYPTNEGRGYVLRRIIRRAIRHGHRLGVRDPFFHRLVAPLEKEMGEAYPELGKQQALVERVLRQEEERFSQTLDQGLNLLEETITGLSGDRIPGEAVFRLYDTYGFPVDLIADVARERGLGIDQGGFEQAMAAQRARARAASRFGVKGGRGTLSVPCKIKSRFLGYGTLASTARIAAIYVSRDDDERRKTQDPATGDEPLVREQGGDGSDSSRSANYRATHRMLPGQRGLIVLDKTPFYAESGGQVGDTGLITLGDTTFTVTDTQHHVETIVHTGGLAGDTLEVGDTVKAQVNVPLRLATARAHTATHLLHAALREILGDHVTQKGSRVSADRLRFDFSHFEPLSQTQVFAIERRINDRIMANYLVETHVMPLEAALASGAIALFDEKYQEEVRVLKIGEHSTELCGGTHAHRAGDIGPFRITLEIGVAAGVRRIEAVSGKRAVESFLDHQARLGRIAALMKSDPEQTEEKITRLMDKNRELERAVAKLTAKMASDHGNELLSQVREIDGVRVLAANLPGADTKSLRDTLDKLKSKLGTPDKSGAAVIVLATSRGEKVRLVAGVTPGAPSGIAAGPLVGFVAEQVGGKGGGRPDMAQGGGTNPARLGSALESVPEWVRAQLARHTPQGKEKIVQDDRERQSCP